MAEITFTVNGVTIFENGEEQWTANGVTVSETQAAVAFDPSLLAALEPQIALHNPAPPVAVPYF